jgi:2-oxoglutarate dehydrogenase E2 component (dihydrolipoamide succinyltransferase)
MLVEIKIPQMGESVVTATIGNLLKPSGSIVKADEEILEIETDKVNQVLYSPAAGTLKLTVKTGDTVKVGQVIGSVDSSGAAAPAKASPPLAAAPKPSSPPPPTSLPPARVKVEEALKTPKPAPLPKTASSSKETRQKMTKLRRVIAERLVQVKNQTAMLTTFNELDMSSVIAVREKEQESFQKRHGVKLGFMSFFIKAAISALQEFPEINGRIEQDEIVFCNYYDMSIAVSTDKGLMVPVIRGADSLSYAEIEKKLKELADKARTGTISVDDLQGGTFTITNAGLFGSLLSTPILNPPQSAILGMHNIVKRPVAVGDQIVIRPMMYLALSYDHRIVDGKTAVLFLMSIKKNLEEPARLLLDL